MSMVGWDVAGIEMDERAAEAARRRHGVDAANVHVGQAEGVELESDSFDLITMTHVVEHLHDPRGVLEKVRTWLRPQGVVTIRCPNFASLERRLFGPKWLGLDLPRHLYHFEPATLTRLLDVAGLRLTRLVAEPQMASFSGSVALTADAVLRRRRTRPIPNWVHHALMPIGAALLAAGASGAMEATAGQATCRADAHGRD
jgi:SAM-dependent methyltransferase